MNVDVDPRRRIRDLPVETQQGVEIARALVTDASVLILDEPTAVLSPSGIEKLFERVRRLKARGVTVILILHKIREVLAVADTVTVLRAISLFDHFQSFSVGVIEVRDVFYFAALTAGFWWATLRVLEARQWRGRH